MKTYTYKKSVALFKRAAKVIPCGIYGHLSPAPLVPASWVRMVPEIRPPIGSAKSMPSIDWPASVRSAWPNTGRHVPATHGPEPYSTSISGPAPSVRA